MVRADADATRGDGESSRARELREALARGEFVTVRAGTYDGWVTAKRRRRMKKTVGEDDGDDFGRAREGAKTSLEGSDAFAVASASVETWGREETERKKRRAREYEDEDETTTGRGERTGADSREDGIEDEDAVRAAIENATRAMHEARREAEGVGKTSAARAASEPSRGRKERKRRRFLRNRDAFSCALCSANETSQWRTLASMDDGDRDEDDALVCNKCYARARRARLVAARER